MNLPDILSRPYETLLAMLRSLDLDVDTRHRIHCELRSRDRALHNQWLEICGGEFK